MSRKRASSSTSSDTRKVSSQDIFDVARELRELFPSYSSCDGITIDEMATESCGIVLDKMMGASERGIEDFTFSKYKKMCMVRFALEVQKKRVERERSEKVTKVLVIVGVVVVLLIMCFDTVFRYYE